jgi:hypothetical protein
MQGGGARRRAATVLPPRYMAPSNSANSEWRLAFTPSIDQLPVVRSIAARAVASFEAELAGAKAHFGLPLMPAMGS